MEQYSLHGVLRAKGLIKEALLGQIPTSNIAQTAATARKMKLRQETTSLGQIATVTAKPTISDKHL